jgi:hypothetical protein
MNRATAVRVLTVLKPALNLDACRDPRLGNGHVSGDGLGGITDAFNTRNVMRLDDASVRAVIAAAYADNAAFGLF